MTSAKILPPEFVRRGLILVFITLLLDIIGIAIISPVMPTFLHELTGDSTGQSSVDGSFLLMVYAIMQFLFAPIIGNLSDRFGRRPILLISIITFALDNLICALAVGYWMLFVGRVLAGMSGASFATCSAYIADISNDKNRTRNFGLIGIAFGVGFILGPLLGGVLGHWGPRVPFYAAAGLSFINFIFSWFMLPETLSLCHRRRFRFSRANPFGALMEMRKYPSVLWILVVFFCYWMAEAVWMTIWSYVGGYRYGWNTVQIGVSLTVFGIGQVIIMSLVLPRLTAGGWSDRRISITGLTFATIGLVGYAFSSQGWMIFAVFAFTCVEYLAHVPLRSIAAREAPPSAQGALQGALTSVTSLTSVIAPVMYAQVFKYAIDENSTFHFAGAPYLLAAVFAFAAWGVTVLFIHPSETGGQSGTLGD